MNAKKSNLIDNEMISAIDNEMFSIDQKNAAIDDLRIQFKSALKTANINIETFQYKTFFLEVILLTSFGENPSVLS